MTVEGSVTTSSLSGGNRLGGALGFAWLGLGALTVAVLTWLAVAGAPAPRDRITLALGPLPPVASTPAEAQSQPPAATESVAPEQPPPPAPAASETQKAEAPKPEPPRPEPPTPTGPPAQIAQLPKAAPMRETAPAPLPPPSPAKGPPQTLTLKLPPAGNTGNTVIAPLAGTSLGTMPNAQLPVPAPRPQAVMLDPALIERGANGPLPKIGPDGRQPWQVYARSVDPGERRPRIAIVVSDLGHHAAVTREAIQRLPGAVTLAFSPYADHLDEWIAEARAGGHEVLLAVPMEPLGLSEADLGPHTLLTSLSPQANTERLEWMLGRATGYVGVTNHMGSRFTASPEALRPVLMELKRRGLMFLDSRSTGRTAGMAIAADLNMPRTINDRFIDNQASRTNIDLRLAELESLARETGVAIGIGFPYPVTLERVSNWTPLLEGKGIALVPITAVANLQKAR